jgi:hypothetical protein
MKNNLLKYYIVAFYTCSNFVLFATTPPQPGNTDGTGGLGGDGDSTPGVPIDDYVWVLLLVGLVFVIIKFRTIYKQQIILKV